SILGAGFPSDDPLHASFGGGRGGQPSHLANGSDSLFLGSSHSATSNRRSPAPPGFGGPSDFLSSTDQSHLSKPLASSLQTASHFQDSDGDFLSSLDRRAMGEIRSHSAAPTFDGGLSMGPPPGLARRETPLVSNRSNARHNHIIGGGAKDSYLEPSMNRSHILQLGQRRPASTGVIGGSQTSSSAVLDSLGLGSRGGAVRPAAKTLMDLIQEDFPPELSIETAGDLYGNDFPRESAYGIERPRTTSPLSSQYNALGNDQYMYPGQNEGDLVDSFGALRVENGSSFPDRTRPTPQYANGDNDRGMGIYAPVAAHTQPSRPQPFNPRQHQQHRIEQSNGYYGGPQTVSAQPQLQTQVLPNGQTVYVNAAPPQQQYGGGYATVQYHPQSEQHHIVHQSVPGVVHRQGNGQQQYISVVPNQGGHVQGVGPGGTYTYWQPPDGQAGGPQTVMILQQGPNGVPIAVQHIGKPHTASTKNRQHQQQRPSPHGGRGKDKNGKSKRGKHEGRKSGGSDAKANGTNGHTASLLDEFKNKKNNRDWSVKDIKGHVVDFCKDQNGSRFVQQRLEVGDSEEKEIVIQELLPAVGQLRNDVFGNYVVQKLLDFGTDQMRRDLRDTMAGEMVALSMQMYGCRVVQKSLERLDENSLPDLLVEFHNNVLSLIHDQNGNHVIQKCIEVLSTKSKSARESGDTQKGVFFSEQIDFIVDDVLANVTSLACHPYGCRVLQRMLEYSQEPKKGMTLDAISLVHRTLLDDQYGNYVIQHVLQFGRAKDRDIVLKMVAENGLLKLARQKFASNVVEKLLKYGNGEQRKAIVREMLRLVDESTGTFVDEESPGTSVVLLMVRDAYANYVVQTMLDVVPESDEKTNLLKELNAHATELKNYTFAKHILTKIS
ncbi:MAG: hypothetical protein SGILL_003371, partial [Bacillariaceae sp.]